MNSTESKAFQSSIIISLFTLLTSVFNYLALFLLAFTFGTQMEMDALSAGCVCKLDFSHELGGDRTEIARRAYLEYILTLTETGEVRSRGTLLFSKAKHFEFADPALQLLVEETADAFRIEASACSFARYVTLDLTEADGVFSDNFFDLSGGERRTIELPKAHLSHSLTLEEVQRQLQAESLFDWS